MSLSRDALLTYRLKRNGIKYPLTTIREARRAGISISLAAAFLDQETNGGYNIFGHDPTIYSGAGNVTKSKYLAYKRRRGHHLMQGVGPMQLTWWEFQDQADHLGGCWVPKYNMRVAFKIIADLIKRNGQHAGIAKYNGTGPAAESYASKVINRAGRWHRILGG